LIRSAAVPCSGEFTAVRSAKPRALALAAVDLRDGPFAPEQRPRHPRPAYLRDGVVDESPDPTRRSSGSGSSAAITAKANNSDERNRRMSCTYATVASPFFSTSDSSLSEAPEGRFSPRSHLLTRLLVTFR
jgi:hypothetical protein